MKIDIKTIKEAVKEEFKMCDYQECTESGMVEFIVGKVFEQLQEEIEKLKIEFKQ